MDIKSRIISIMAALVFSTQAQAIQITSASQSFVVDWSATTTNGSLLSATSTWLVDSFSLTQIQLSISITNTTILTSLLTNADITTFGFGVDPNATASILTAGSTFDMVGAGSGKQQTFPGGYKQIDVCIFAQGCAGGTVNDALNAGESDYITLLLSGDFSGGYANLLFFPAKFQTSDGSYEPAGCVNGNGCTTVPEPSVPALLGIGLLLVGAARARRVLTARF
jgi:hypothetical protein